MPLLAKRQKWSLYCVKQLFSWFFVRSGCYPVGIDEVAAGFYLGALHTRESLQPLHQRESLNQNE